MQPQCAACNQQCHNCNRCHGMQSKLAGTFAQASCPAPPTINESLILVKCTRAMRRHPPPRCQARLARPPPQAEQSALQPLSARASRTAAAAKSLTACRRCTHCLPYTTLNRRTASRMLSRWPKALARTKPSPPGPKPLPGVVTMSHFSRISANTSHDLRPAVGAVWGGWGRAVSVAPGHVGGRQRAGHVPQLPARGWGG